jgi:site-specific DNA-methyltransferase (adenine-specific)
MSAVVMHGDCLDVLAALPDGSVDAVVTDPPYELGFMGKAWDGVGVAYSVDLWRHALRVLKPGGHLLAFGGTRTYHRMACAVEDAGFEIRDSITWLYGSGFPKSLDVSKAIDKAAGATREVIGRTVSPFRVDAAASRGTALHGSVRGDFSRQTAGGYRYTEHTAPATDDAARWSGWGTALKPASEPIVVARKPLAGTVAANVQAHGTGALNIDACRVAATDKARFPAGIISDTERVFGGGAGTYDTRPRVADRDPSGRWPANLVLSHAADCHEGGPCVNGCPVAELDAQSGALRARGNVTPTGGGGGMYGHLPTVVDHGPGDSGGASRFFPTFRYQAKAPARERPKAEGIAHPTVKPLALMRWLVRLVTPPGGTVLDPFAGSGTTAEACLIEGVECIAIEREAAYLPLIQARIDRCEVPDAVAGR